MPSIIREYAIEWAPYSATEPTTWNKLERCIRNLPNFFPDPETIDTSTVDNKTPTSIPAAASGEAYGFTVAPNKEFLDAHESMITDQLDDTKGSFWLRVKLTNRGQYVTGQFRTVEYLPTPEGAFGELDEITWNVYAASDLSVTPVSNETPSV